MAKGKKTSSGPQNTTQKTKDSGTQSILKTMVLWTGKQFLLH
jgi:hypothetical protein